MLSLYFERIDELEGELRPLTGKAVVSVEYLKLHPQSKKNLADVLQHKRITSNNQNLLIDELVISPEGKAILEKGQNSVVKMGNTYAVTADARHPTRFSAVLRTAVPSKVDTAALYACEITLGNIEFDLSNCPAQTLEGGGIIYRRVPMTLYPAGRYSTEVLE